MLVVGFGVYALVFSSGLVACGVEMALRTVHSEIYSLLTTSPHPPARNVNPGRAKLMNINVNPGRAKLMNIGRGGGGGMHVSQELEKAAFNVLLDSMENQQLNKVK